MSLLNKFQREGVEISRVYDGESWEKIQGKSALESRKIATEIITSVDQACVQIKYKNFVADLLIVLGNDEAEILCDWSCKYDDLYHIIEEVESEFYNQWEKV